MAVGVLFEIRCGPTEYDEVMRRLADAGESQPGGRMYHVAGPIENGWRVIDVWQSAEALQRFSQTLIPIMQDVGIPPVQPEVFPAHNIVHGLAATAP